MKTELAEYLIPIRMEEMGYKKFIPAHRHLRLNAEAEIKINAANEFYFLIEEDSLTIYSSKYEGSDSLFRIVSESGIYDLSERKADEMQHEHTGNITVKNLTKIDLFIKFIQVIPKHD